MIHQKEDLLLWVILDHGAMMMLITRSQEQLVLMVGDLRQDKEKAFQISLSNASGTGGQTLRKGD